MRVLIACEFSGRVREAFARRGHFAVSCDLLENEGPLSQNSRHHQGPVEEILENGWDLMIAHPPCTYLARSGIHWNSRIPGRAEKTEDALEFVRLLMKAPIEKKAIENPIGVISTRIRRPDQVIHPWQFGHGEEKTTCLWLEGLPPLEPTEIVAGRKEVVLKMPPSKDRWKLRSVTYQGIADAMAAQWG